MAQTIIVDISTRGANPVAYTHQGDTDRTFLVNLFENGEAFGVAGFTVKVAAILPGDSGYTVITGADMVSATKTTTGTNQLMFTPSAKYTARSGRGILTLIMTTNTGTPATIRPINIDFRIQKSADGPDVIEGASDFPEGLEEIAEQVFQEYLSTYLPPVAPSASAAANKAADAKLTGEALDDLKSDLSYISEYVPQDLAIERGWVGGSGSTYSETAGIHAWLPVTAGQKYKLVTWLKHDVAVANFFKENKTTRVSSVAPNLDYATNPHCERIVTVPDDAVYMVVNSEQLFNPQVYQYLPDVTQTVSEAALVDGVIPTLDNKMMWSSSQGNAVYSSTTNQYIYGSADPILMPKGSKLITDIGVNARIFRKSLDGEWTYTGTEESDWRRNSVYTAEDDEYIYVTFRIESVGVSAIEDYIHLKLATDIYLQIDNVNESLSNKVESSEVSALAESVSAETNKSATMRTFIDTVPMTKIVASEEMVFTGRGLYDVVSSLDNTIFATKNNGRAARGYWGSGVGQDVVQFLNTLPKGTYTFSVEFLLESLNTSYDGTTAQKAYLSLPSTAFRVIPNEIDLSDYSTGDSVRLSITFKLTDSSIGTIQNLYMYIPQSNASTQKWKCRIMNAQIESGELSDYSEYKSVTAKEVVAFDRKMSAYYNGDYTLNYWSVSISSSESKSIAPYFVTEVEDCKNKLEAYCSEKALVYLVVTDSHVHTDSQSQARWSDTIKNISAVNDVYQADALIHLGDMINGSLPEVDSKEIIRMIRDDMRSIIEPNFILVGNHDTNTFYGSNMEEPITEAEMYGLWERYNEKDITSRPSGKPYWYKDYESFGIRVVYLSSSMGDGTHGGQGTNWGYPEAERIWFRDVALDTNLQVLLFSHMPFTKGYISTSVGLPQYGDDMISICENFIQNGGTVIGLVNGHTHFDLDNNNGSFHEISLGCETNTSNSTDLHGSEISSSIAIPSTAVCYGRTDGTLTQDLWSILVVRPESKTCKIIRFGAGNDVEWSY